MSGGFWTDRADAQRMVDEKERHRTLSAGDAAALRFWIRNGYWIIPGAVDPSLTDAVIADVDAIFEGKIAGCLVQDYSSGKNETIPAEKRHRDGRVKLLDIYAVSEAARRAQFSPKISAFLELVFEKPAMAFQGLYFQGGQEQPLHRDSAYVKVEPLMSFAASWIAMEDIQPGSGELEFVPGSHTFKDYLFSGGSKWHVDGDEHGPFLRHWRDQMAERGVEAKKFSAKKGDALIWCADLVHGGGKISDWGLSRRSFVTHYCPVDASPLYFRYPPYAGPYAVGPRQYIALSSHGYPLTGRGIRVPA